MDNNYPLQQVDNSAMQNSNQHVVHIQGTEHYQEVFSMAERNECYEACIKGCGSCTGSLAAWGCSCCSCCCGDGGYQQIAESHFGVIKEFGKFTKVLPSGLHFVNPLSEEIIMVDRREMVVDLKQQNIMTKDNVYVRIDAVVYYHIEDSYKALFSVQSYQDAIVEIAKTSLRDVCGHHTLQDTLETKEKMAAHIKELIETPTFNWGITITRVLIQDIIFSPELQQNLSSAATAKRIAESKIISAQADVDSAKLLREASDILNTPAAMQMRYLDSMTSLAKGNNTKIIFMPGNQ